MQRVDERGWWVPAPPGSDEDLQQRLAMASPADTSRGMFLRATLDAVRILGDEEAVRRCQRVSGEEKLVDFFSYPVSANLRMVFTAARMLEARSGGISEALRLLGRGAAACFLSSTAGLALQLLAGGDTNRMVGNMPSMYRASVSFGVRSVVWMGPTSCRLTMRREFMPASFQEGLLLGVLEKAHARGARVVGQQLSTLESDYDVSWVA
ncbi:MAG TPA: TIGR02265 family protein [Archangium sp.]|uniref:TIGR02265 family protein n=1 Tax=Archangium sp. TaxID=1872627 RepID=UPI002E300F05|nr:TIGR02265 family protein [Archangium sp.]HEX5745559.1 TIGR02265 family protein [Archangium sp.]